MVSRQFPRCICDTTSKSRGRKCHHKGFKDTGQERPECQSQKDDSQGQSAYHGTENIAGHDIYANEGIEIPAIEQAVIGTGMAIRLPCDTYGRIATQCRLAVKHRLTTKAGVIDADYMREVKIVLVNQGNQPYQLKPGDRIAQLII